MAKKIKIKSKISKTQLQSFPEFFEKNSIFLYESESYIKAEVEIIRQTAKSIHHLKKENKFGFIISAQQHRKIKLEVLKKSDLGDLWKTIFKKCRYIPMREFFEITLTEELSEQINKKILEDLVALGKKT